MRFGLLIFISSVSLAQTNLRGLEWEDDAYRQFPFKPSYFVPTNHFPAAYSLKVYCPRIVNQAITNNGVAWAAVWYARSMALAIESGLMDQAAITRRAFSPGFNYKPDSRGGCDAPVRLSAVLSSLQLDGALPLADFQEVCAPDSIAPELIAQAKLNRLPGFVKLFNANDPKQVKVRTIKEALLSKHPVVIGMICPPSFSLAKDFWQPREEPDKAFGGHGLCVVGYDDSRFGGSFQVANSWGHEWAEGGFTELRYDDLARFVLYGYELISVPKNPDGMAVTVATTLSDGTMMSSRYINDGFYRLAKSWPTGTQFQVKLEFSSDLFFYAIAFDEKRNHEILYPPEKSIYPWVQTQGGPVILPSASSSIRLTEPAGKNYILLIFSGREMKPGEMIKELEEAKGDFGQPLMTAKGSAKATWSKGGMTVNSEWSSETLIPMLIQIDQY